MTIMKMKNKDIQEGFIWAIKYFMGKVTGNMGV